MARIIGGIATSHIPSIGKAIAHGSQNDPAWKAFFDGYKPVHEWLGAERPDAAVVVYNDHGLNFFLDKMPTFAIGAVGEYAMPMKAGDFLSYRPCSDIPSFHGISSNRSSPMSLISRLARRCWSTTDSLYPWICYGRARPRA